MNLVIKVVWKHLVLHEKVVIYKNLTKFNDINVHQL